jgi:hypothetical protein
MTAQYLTAKRDLISTAKQLAGMAGEHGKTLVRSLLYGKHGHALAKSVTTNMLIFTYACEHLTQEKLRLSDEQLAAAQQELNKVQAQLQDILQVL